MNKPKIVDYALDEKANHLYQWESGTEIEYLSKYGYTTKDNQLINSENEIVGTVYRNWEEVFFDS